MKCSRCGVRSDIDELFTVKKRSFGLTKKTYCPVCWEKRYFREQLLSNAWIVLVVIVLDVLTYERGLSRVLLDLLFLALINFPLVAAHELAHAAAGKVLGVRVFKVTVGYGKMLFSRRMAGITWELHVWPYGGGTMMACPPQPGSRWRLFGAVLAGPLMHGVLMLSASVFQLFLLILQGWYNVDAMILIRWTNLFVLTNLILLIFNALPLRAATPAGEAGTDGWPLIHLAFLKPGEQEILDQSYFVTGTMDASLRNDADSALRWIEQGLTRYPGQPVLRTSLGVNLIKKARYSEAREVFLELLSSEEAKQPYFKHLMYNNIAYADVLIQDPSLIPEADRYSGESFRQLRWESMAIGTRGAVLVETGRVEEGIVLLKEALEKSRDAFGKASDAYHLAVGESRRGNAEESRKYLELARKYDPDLFLLDSNPQKVPLQQIPSL